MIRIAVDAMGGDYAPRSIVDGALAAARHLPLGLALTGPADILEAELARHQDAGRLDVRILDAPDVIGMHESPSAALRRTPHASIRLAADAVARGDAAGLVSAGHTGATAMAAYAAFGMLPGVDRPALAATVPSGDRLGILLDVGANVECRPPHLLQFAVMGSVYAHVSLGIERPRIGLLSIGEEETKGNELTRDAHRLLKASALNFIGNVEAAAVYSGTADVIVCDGFTGNVALKVSEGLVDTIELLLGEELAQTFSGRVGSLLSRRAFRRFRRRLDYSEYGGAPLLGVAGVCIVGHGRSSAKAVRNAVAMAYRFAKDGLIQRVEQEIAAATVARACGPSEAPARGVGPREHK
jgi:glycerol-3-phosphate acyltransferase PlsX